MNEVQNAPEMIKKLARPLLRGWSHAIAAVVALIVTILLCWLSRDDIPRMISMFVFGLSMIELYTMSALYHIITWPPEKRRIFRAIDHANIFILIAGTYTPLCFNVLDGWIRPTILIVIWSLAIIGISSALVTIKLPRWVTAALYVGMGWVAVLAFPAFISALSWWAMGMLVLGGVLYTIGAIIYARKKPNPFPRVWGYHEIFHLFVIAGSAAFVACIWIWVLPFPRR